MEPPSSPAAPTEPANGTAAADTDATLAPPDGDILMDAPSPFDPLFDDMGGDADAEGESVLPSNDATADPTPAQTPRPVSNGFGLALPGSNSTTTKPLNDDTKPATASAPLFSHSNAQAGPSRSGAGAAGSIPLLTHTTYDAFSEDIMMTSSMDGQVTLIDRRVPSGSEGGVGRLQAGERAPPWCMSVRRPKSTCISRRSLTPCTGMLVRRWKSNIGGETKWNDRHMGRPPVLIVDGA